MITNEEILQVADECEEWVSDDKCVLNPITFARRIAAMQREIDAGICKREGADDVARMIRSQSDE